MSAGLFQRFLKVSGVRRRRAGACGCDHLQQPITLTQARHHPVFQSFPPVSGPVKGGFYCDFVGSLTSHETMEWGAPRNDYHVATEWPPLDEEYFEWTDILEAVKEAKDSFTFVEAGAGWGRWSARALKAAQRFPGIKTAKAVLIEPHHGALARTHMAHNGFQAEEEHYTLIEAALDVTLGRAQFYVSPPPGFLERGKWMGQALAYEPMQGWGIAEVEVTTLAKTLPFGPIDLVDMDIQGAEARVISSAIGILSDRVRRLHIGTHSAQVEAQLHGTLQAAGWTCVRSYPCGTQTETPFGVVRFGDGVQSWTNPRAGRSR